MRRQLGIRGRVLAVLALPVLVVALTAGVLVSATLAEARTSREVGAVAAAQDRVVLVEAALQAERLLSLTPRADAVPGALAEARAVTDREITALTSGLGRTGIAASLPGAARILDADRAAHARLIRLRQTIDADPDAAAGSDPVRSGYAEVIAIDVELPGAIGGLLPDRSLGVRLAGCSALGRAVEASEQARLAGLALIDLSGAGGRTGTTGSAADGSGVDRFDRALLVALDRHARAVQAFRASAPAGPDALGPVGAAAGRFDALATELLDPVGSGGTVPISAVAWSTAADQQAAALRQAARDVAQDAANRAERTAGQHEQRAAGFAAGSVGLVGLMLLLALIQSRRITAPLRSLAVRAVRIRQELPELVDALSRGEAPREPSAIQLTTRDEAGQVAGALRELQATVLQIAREQVALRGTLAETFVNVARRNQVLLARQLSFIDRLEHTEQDPDGLENLFRLDHLATRMRRNAESLLVLAGQEPGRRVREPMTLSDVIRAAVGEIEHFDRVYVAAETDPLVAAHLCLPTAHLLAELLENATAFSDPGAIVAVRAGATPDGIRVTVTDQGMGLTFEELAEANSRLAAYATHPPKTAEAVGAQRLGLYVVARLAARLTARVRLTPGAQGGTVAVVDLPTVLFQPGSVPELATAYEAAAPHRSGERPGAATGLDLAALDRPSSDRLPMRRPVGPLAGRAEEPAGADVSEQPPPPPTPPLPEPPPEPLPEQPRHAQQSQAPQPVSAPTPVTRQPSHTMDVLPRQPSRSSFRLPRFGRRGRGQGPAAAPSPAHATDTADAAVPGGRRTAVPAPHLSSLFGPSAAEDQAQDGEPPAAPVLERRGPNRAVDDGTGAAQRMRGTLASEALAELSSLAAYSPRPGPAPAAGLVRRTAAPPVPVQPAAEAQPRPLSPDAVRSTLSGFAAGVARARRTVEPDHLPDDVPDPTTPRQESA